MIKKQTALLNVNRVLYLNLSEPTRSQFNLYEVPIKYISKALRNADKNGKFFVRDYEDFRGIMTDIVHTGKIAEIEFQGKRRLTKSELENMPFEPDNPYTEESIIYSFKQWHKEGRPFKLKLSRREEYNPL